MHRNGVHLSLPGSLRCSGRRCERHSGDAYQVAGRHGELELVVDSLQPAKHGLANPADRLSPTEMFLDAFANDLAQAVARMARGASVDRASAAAGIVAGDVRRDFALAARSDEVGGTYEQYKQPYIFKKRQPCFK